MNIENVVIKGNHDEATIRQIRTCAAEESARHAVLAADGHRGYNMPIGGIVAYQDMISPAGVGFDIACGNKAVRLDASYDDVREELLKIADAIFSSLSFGVGLTNRERVDHDLFDDEAWKDVGFLRRNQALKPLAREQLGTIGSGVSPVLA